MRLEEEVHMRRLRVYSQVTNKKHPDFQKKKKPWV
jgi:hypothetical protein